MSTVTAKDGRWYALFVLTAIFSVHYVDRSVMSVVIEPIKAEFGASDAAMGILTGLAHSTALSIMVLPMGWLADRVNRVRLVSAVAIVWSLLTALGFWASSYTSLLLMRIGVGAAEAGGPPASVSIIADRFDGKELPTAMGIYYIAMAVGTGSIFLFGGYVAQHFGWRAVFLIAGVPGILLGLLLLFTVREPARPTATIGTAAPKLSEVARLLATNHALLFVMLAGTAATIAQASIFTWMASFMIRTHALSLGQAGLVVAAAAGLGKGLGSGIAGPLTRRLGNDQLTQQWRFPALMLVLSWPVGWAMVLVPGAMPSIAFAMLLSLMLGCWSGQVVAILMAAAEPRLRGTTMSFYSLLANLIGVGVGPLLTGAISDAVGGKAALGSAIGWTLSFNLVAALCFYLSCRALVPRSSAA